MCSEPSARDAAVRGCRHRWKHGIPSRRLQFMHTTDAAGGVAHIHHHYRSLGHRYVSMAVEACVACPKPSTHACRSAACKTHCCAVSSYTRLPPPGRRCKYAHINRQVQRLLRRHRRQHVLLRRRPNIRRSRVLRGLLRCPCGHFESHTCAVGCSYPVTNCNAQPGSDRLSFAFANGCAKVFHIP